MTYQIVKKFPDDILFEQEGPFISLYLPTNRHSPENKQDPIVYKNLLKTIEASLLHTYASKDVSNRMSALHEIGEDKELWNNTLNGLAILSSPDRCVVYKLYDAVEPLAIVAESFHTKPLIKAYQSIDQYLLLGLKSNEFDLFQGNQNGIVKVELEPGTARDIEAVLGNQLTESYLTQGSFNGVGHSPMYHGHGGAKPEIDKDTEKFFRYVDRFVDENYSKPMKLPLILVALQEHHSTFAKISNNPYLVKDGIKGEYSSFSLEQLREKTWALLEPIYLAQMQEHLHHFEQAKASGLGSDSLAVISRAVFENRLDTLFVDVDRIVPGKIEPETGKIFDRDIDEPNVGDVLDALAQLALKSKNDVVVLPSETIPGKAGIAAIFRY